MTSNLDPYACELMSWILSEDIPTSERITDHAQHPYCWAEKMCTILYQSIGAYPTSTSNASARHEELRADPSQLREEVFGWNGIGYKVVAKASTDASGTDA